MSATLVYVDAQAVIRNPGTVTLQSAVGKRVRELRKAKGFSQEDFADHCGVHRTFMGTLERGESNISIETLAKIAKGLGITMSEVLKGIE